MKNQSVSRRIKKTKNVESRRQILSDWMAAWELDQTNIVNGLLRSVKAHDHRMITRAAAQLRAVSEKRFVALSNVLATLIEDCEGLSVPNWEKWIEDTYRWENRWEDQQNDTVYALCSAAHADDHGTILDQSRKAKEITQERFKQLRTVMNTLITDLEESRAETE